jgi:hypothetical protein
MAASTTATPEMSDRPSVAVLAAGTIGPGPRANAVQARMEYLSRSSMTAS